jgi:hypothetical protein
MMIQIWLSIWGDYNRVINDGVHIYTLAYWSFHLGTEVMSNHGGFYNKMFPMLLFSSWEP